VSKEERGREEKKMELLLMTIMVIIMKPIARLP
jgi:hypothetical protein